MKIIKSKTYLKLVRWTGFKHAWQLKKIPATMLVRRALLRGLFVCEQ